MATRPLVIVLGGPNGAGKSTAASRLLPSGIVFLNADEIAKALPGYPSRAADLEAGRLALQQMEELERQRTDFAVETTLASRSLASRVARLRGHGYVFRPIFVWSPSPEFSIERVAARVRAGGHDIPEETIRRRFHLGIRNFFDLYRPLADVWDVHANLDLEGFVKIAEGRGEGIESIHDPELWELMKEAGDGA